MQFFDVRDNRQIHCIKADKDDKFLLTNAQSCYCGYCLCGEKENCFSTEYIEEWNTVELKQSTQPSKKITRSKPLPEACHVGSITEMVTQSSIVAVAAESDANYDYYPMKVTSNSIEKLEDSEKYDYGTTMAAG